MIQINLKDFPDLMKELCLILKRSKELQKVYPEIQQASDTNIMITLSTKPNSVQKDFSSNSTTPSMRILNPNSVQELTSNVQNTFPTNSTTPSMRILNPNSVRELTSNVQNTFPTNSSIRNRIDSGQNRSKNTQKQISDEYRTRLARKHYEVYTHAIDQTKDKEFVEELFKTLNNSTYSVKKKVWDQVEKICYANGYKFTTHRRNNKFTYHCTFDSCPAQFVIFSEKTKYILIHLMITIIMIKTLHKIIVHCFLRN